MQNNNNNKKQTQKRPQRCMKHTHTSKGLNERRRNDGFALDALYISLSLRVDEGEARDLARKKTEIVSNESRETTLQISQKKSLKMIEEIQFLK